MSLSAQDVRQWLERFEAAEQVDRMARRDEGPRSSWSIAVALSLISAVPPTSRASWLDLRASEDEEVRRTWDKLRAGLVNDR